MSGLRRAQPVPGSWSARPARWPAAGLTALLLAGCGSGSHHPATTGSPPTTTTSAGRAAKTTGTSGHPTTSAGHATRARGPSRLTEAVRTLDATSFASSIRADRGQQLILRTGVTGALVGRPVTVSLHTAPGHVLIVAASAGGQRAQARIIAPSKRPISLVSLEYACPVSPQPTFCPARDAHGNARGATLRFTARHSSLIELTGTVGPVAGAPVAHAAGRAAVAAYTPEELLRTRRARGPHGAAPARGVARAATVAPGDTAVLITRLTPTGRIGAPQPVTVSFRAGPARSITVQAAVGAKRSRATLRGARGPIALRDLHVSCAVPPVASSCPVDRAVDTGGVETLRLRTTPYAPVVVIARVGS